MNASDYSQLYKHLQDARRIIKRCANKRNDNVLDVQYDKLGNIIRVICDLQIKEEQDGPNAI